MATYSTNWRLVEPRIGAQPIAEVSTTQNHPLGTILRARDIGATNNLTGNGEGEFIYVKGVSSGATGAWVGIDEDGATTLAIADGYYPLVGVLMADLDATTKYGWTQITGKAVALALTGYADNANVYLTGTAGSVDDTAVAGDLVHRALGASALDAPAAGMAEFFLNRPSTDNNVDDAT